MTLLPVRTPPEDRRQWGVPFAPEAALAVLNQHASETVLPQRRVAGAVASTTAEIVGALTQRRP